MSMATIYSKPKTKSEAEDPEVLIQGYGRMFFSQLKNKVITDHENAVRFLKSGNYASYNTIMTKNSKFVEAILDIEAEMNKPSYKRMKSRLKEDNLESENNIITEENIILEEKKKKVFNKLIDKIKDKYYNG